MGIKTSFGRRQADFLAEKEGKQVLVEVKSGKGRRTKAQKAKDKEIAEKGGTLVGKNVPRGKKEGDIIQKKTIELRVKDEDIK